MNILTLSIGLSLLSTMTLGGCQSTGSPESPGSTTQDPVSRLTSLENKLTPLQNHFNAHPDRHRFLAILSPT